MNENAFIALLFFAGVGMVTACIWHAFGPWIALGLLGAGFIALATAD